MSDSTFRISLLVVAGLLYLGVFGYSVFSYTGVPFQDQNRSNESGAQTSQRRTMAPMVMYYGSGVRVYDRRSVRSMNQRGGGIRGGK